jgi:hypothetical protein
MIVKAMVAVMMKVMMDLEPKEEVVKLSFAVVWV